MRVPNLLRNNNPIERDVFKVTNERNCTVQNAAGSSGGSGGGAGGAAAGRRVAPMRPARSDTYITCNEHAL